ncbi:MAG: trigger factor [Acidobacteria bacterium]|nr:trigger factor [Acidobacteriota bacterium]
MTVEIVEVNSCKRNLAVEIPASEVDQEVSNLAREYARNAKVPGFRPGKAPLSIIRQRYGSELWKDATQKIIERCWRDAVEEHKLQPLAEPVVKDMEHEPGSPLKFTVAFEIMPPVEVKEYKGLKVTVPRKEIGDEDVNRSLEMIREQHAQYVPAEGAEAQDGLILTLTVEYRIGEDDNPIRDEGVSFEMGHPRTDTAFAEHLRGAKAGESRTFEVAYPEDHIPERFAGKKVSYDVTVTDIKKKEVPELNDEFSKDLGYEDVQTFTRHIRDELVRQEEVTAEKKAREMLLDTIVEQQPVDIPDCMVQDELESRTYRIATDLAIRGIDINQAAIDWKKVFEEERPRAEQAVRRHIFLDAIARQEGIEVTSEEVDSELEKMSADTGKSAAVLRAQLEKEGRIQSLERHLRQNKALDFIYRNANISVG